MSKYVQEKKEYVSVLNKALQPLEDFGRMEYRSVYNSGEEYVKLNDSMGGAKFMNVTGQDLETILLEVIELIVTGKSDHTLTSKDERRVVASLFEKGN